MTKKEKNNRMEEYTLVEKLNALFTYKNIIKFEGVKLLKDDEWHNRIHWYELDPISRDVISRSGFWGFDDIESATDDCLDIMSIKNY